MKSVSISNRVICYIDVLGFKDKVSKTEKSEEENFYQKFLKTILDTKKEIDEKRGSSFMTISSVSDAILITGEYTKDENIPITFRTVCNYASAFQEKLLNNLKLLSRGSISIGKIHHSIGDTNFPIAIYGEGFIHAYLLENQALYPRIILCPTLKEFCKSKKLSSFVKAINNQKYSSEKSDIIKRDADGIFYINYHRNVSKLISLTGDETLSVYQKYEWLNGKIKNN